jgi:hypothetical protein
MPELGMSGSVGAAGEKSHAATRLNLARCLRIFLVDIGLQPGF